MTKKHLTHKQRTLLAEFAEQIRCYRDVQAKADSIEFTCDNIDEVSYWQAAAGELLHDLEFFVAEEYRHVPYRKTRNSAINAFMRLIVGE